MISRIKIILQDWVIRFLNRQIRRTHARLVLITGRNDVSAYQHSNPNPLFLTETNLHVTPHDESYRATSIKG